MKSGHSWEYFLVLVIICLIIQAFYAMLEMACVSFNKVRLQYYVSKHHRRAIWLSYLLNHPTLLFGSTLIAVNTALQFGSESARLFYLSLGLNPSFAPITQVLIVLIFAEISPMFAGRRYAENVAMLGVPIIYFTSLVLRPVIWLLDLLCTAVNKLVKSPTASGIYLSREELQKVIEERDDVTPPSEELNTVIANIFTLKNKTAKDLMKPLDEVQMIPSFCTIAELRRLLAKNYTPFLPIYHPTPKNIIAIAYPRDLLRLPDNRRVREQARPPWFITQGTSIIQILKQFQRNNQSLAIVLNEAGQAEGILTLDEIIDEVIGQSDEWQSLGDVAPRLYHVVVDRSFPGDMLIADFNKQFNVHLHYEGAQTLQELVNKFLGHPPAKGEELRIDQFELTVEEVSLLGAKTIAIRTVY